MAKPVVSPLLAWSNLTAQWMEMMAASSQVITHRTSRKLTPARLARMGNEKFLVGMQASTAMAPHLVALASAQGTDIMGAWARVLASGMAPFHSRATRNARRIRRR